MFSDFIFNAIEGIMVGLVSLPIVIIVHELGHLLFGKLSGYKFISLRLIFFQWAKDKDNKIKFTKATSLGGGVGGQCLMIPGQEEKDFRYMLYNLGGSLANLIMGVALIVPLFFSSGQTIMRWLFIAGVVSIFLALANLIPSTSGGFPNDGKNVKEAGKSEDAKNGFYRMLKANGEMALGKHLSDFDEKFFVISKEADVNNFFVAYSILLHGAHLEELGDYEASYERLMLIENAKIPSLYRAQVLMVLLFNELVYQSGDEALERAKKRWESHRKDKDINAIVLMKHPSFMIPYAAKKAFIDLDPKTARRLASEAEKLIPNLQNPGTEHLAKVTLERLRERLPKPIAKDAVNEGQNIDEVPEENVTETLSLEEALEENVTETLSLEEALEENVTETLSYEEDTEESSNKIATEPLSYEENTEEYSEDSKEGNSNFDDIMERLKSRNNNS